jgi:parallel beta-helix repeat protein
VLLAAPAFGSTYTIQIGAPNGTDDTVVIQGALDECVNNHPMGCTIRLSAGKYLSGPLTATNFHGSIAGTGMNATVIEAITPFPVWSNLFTFSESAIAISDLTLRVTAYQPVTDCSIAIDGFCGLFALVGDYGSNASASLQRVALEGGPGADWGFGAYNLYGGLLFDGPGPDQEVKGDLQVIGSRFKNMSEGVRAFDDIDSHVTIGGSAADGNTFDNQVISVFLAEDIRSVIGISQNTVTNSSIPFLIDQGVDYQHDAATYNFQHNAMQVSGNFNYGIIIDDLNYPQSGFAISNNDISFVNCTGCEGIIVSYVKDAVISNNKFSGTAMDGIHVWASDECVVKANNLQTLAPSWAGIVLDTDYLDTPNIPTMNCTVVGGNPKDTVWVDPESTGNTIVGVNNMHGNPPGPAVRDAMRWKKQMRMAAIAPPR